MALMLLQVLVLGVFAVAADDVPLTWYYTSRALVPCTLPAPAPPPRKALPLHEDAPYSWRRDGLNYTHKILGNGTLEVRKRDADGVFQCTAAVGRGYLLGYPVRLQSAHLEKFSKYPENTTARRGQPVALPCEANSTPPANISWLKDDQDLPADDRFYLLKNQLLITDVRDSDAGVYRCIATNANLNKSRNHAGQLYVAPPEPQALELMPTFEDRELRVPEGGDVVLPCPVAGWPRPSSVTWELAGKRLHDGPVLVLKNIDVRQEGVYTCRVPGQPDLQKTYNVTVTQPVNITLPPVSKAAIRAGTIRFNCTASGRPAPNVTWYKDGVPLVLSEKIGLWKAAFLNPGEEERIELVINSITSKDAGVYQCFASNNVSMASAWATLLVTGPAAPAPQHISCAPLGAKEVVVRWAPVPTDVLAYTVHTTAQEPGGTGRPLGPPVRDTHAVVPIPEPLTPYRFQVRAYIQSAKGAATDFSEFVVCQGQGVPINLTKMDKSVLVSWQNFARQTPGVVEWIVQSRMADQPDGVTDVTLNGTATSYTLDFEPDDGDLQVRVLGTRSLPWLTQNLSSVPWRSLDLSTGDLKATPRNLMVTRVGPHGFTVQWETDDLSPRTYNYLVCVTKVDDPATGDEFCQSSKVTSATIEGLLPASEYEVRVVTQLQDLEPAEAVLPYRVSTLADEATSISSKFINGTTVQVSWNVPGRYTVRHRQKTNPPGNWTTVETDGNTVLLTGINPKEETSVEVTSHEGTGTKTLTIARQVDNVEAKDLSYVYTSSGITVSWVGTGPRMVKFAQNITQPLEKWLVVNVTGSHVQLVGLDRSRATYVTVTAAGSGQVLSIPPAPERPSVAIGVGLGCAACVLLLVAGAALLAWRRRKARARPGSGRSRRRTMSPTEGHEGESSEMKNIGGRLANGGAAGEPLLNGHVHITENPTSKTPNGKTKKARYEPLDVSRHDASATRDAALAAPAPASASASASASRLLDTSRRPHLDLSRSSRLSANDSFNKLPDDNMNSEITRSSEFTLDNSKIQPTLQPNG